MKPAAAAIPGRPPARFSALLHRMLRLSFDDWRGAVLAAWLMCRVAVRLRRGNFNALLDSLGLREAAAPASPQALARAEQLVRWAHRLMPLQPNCLLDSLTAAVLLRRMGMSAPLSIGVKITGQQMEAHAWLGDCAENAANFRLLYRVPAEPQA